MKLNLNISSAARRRLSVAWVLLLLFAGYGFVDGVKAAETHADRIKACSVIPVEVPDFKCDDGYEIAKFVDSKRQCKSPENLYGRCVYQSTLGQLKPKNKDGVEIFYSCRKDPHGANAKNDYKNDKSGEYYDIAVIQHNPKTGDTCFYQRLGNYPGNKKIPAPKDDDGTFWNEKPNICTACHTNGPFIRTPHYSKVLDDKNTVIKTLPSGAKPDDYIKVKNGYIKLLASQPGFDSSKSLKIGKGYVKAFSILPDAYRRKHGKYLYKVLHENAAVWDVSKKNNTCVECHSIGALQTSRDIDKAMEMSPMNQLAVGEIMSLVEGVSASECFSHLKSKKCPSPTKTGYHPFMDGMMGASKADLDDIKTCFVEKSKRPKDCVVRNPGQASGNPILKWGGELLQDIWGFF